MKEAETKVDTHKSHLYRAHKNGYYTIFHYHPKNSITWTMHLYICMNSRLKRKGYCYTSYQGRKLQWGFRIPLTNIFLKYSSQPFMKEDTK